MLKLLDLVDMVNRSNANGHRIAEVRVSSRASSVSNHDVGVL